MNTIISTLEAHARTVRSDIVRMIYQAGDGHPGASLSVTDMIVALYFHLMSVRPAEPGWDDRDRFVLSKGHSCPALYATLARKGYFPVEDLPGLRTLDSHLQGHPDMMKTPGVDATTGSLGNGVAIGAGMAMAARIKGRQYKTYVITGDGELQEGVIWESFMTARHFDLGNLIVFIDNNGLQSGGAIEDMSGLAPILPKLEAFGWHCQQIDGHDMGAIVSSAEAAAAETSRPSVILAHTKKGRGVPFMEGDNSWHKRVPTKEEYELAIEAIGAEL